MGSHGKQEAGRDLTQGVTLEDFGGEALLRGHVGEDPVVLARVGDEVLAVGASCTHYGGPLDQGLVVGDTVRCPWHHACFSLRTGEALGAPAFDSIPCYRVERQGDAFVVREALVRSAPSKPTAASGEGPQDIVIVGGGAAGFACAEMLRRRGYDGRLTMVSDDADPPCDRPNLSKDYLAGQAPEEWIPLRPESFYQDNRIDLRLGVAVTGIDVAARTVATTGGQVLSFDRLLLATGAEPVRLPIPGAEREHVYTLRSLANSRAIIERAKVARSAVVLGSGFIGLETAAALRARGLEVHVVSLDERPLERVLGPELGDLLQGLHQDHGVVFHFKTSIDSIGAETVRLQDGAELPADLVILGVGVRPRTALAQAAGLAVNQGIVVDQHLETSAPGIYAAGDVARLRLASSGGGASDGEDRRVEHWVVAERHGQTVAENMLGAQTRFRDAPFFWSAHYDLTIGYVGHAPRWDALEIDGDLAARDATVRYLRGGEVVAVATIGRDVEALAAGERLAIA